MLRKTLVTLVSVAALGLGSAAMAAHGGGGGFGRGGGGAGFAATPRGGVRPMMMHGGNMGAIRGGPMTAAPMTGRRVQGWGGRAAWGHNHFRDHFHNRFHNRNFFAFGFGGPIYDYSYGSCWSWNGWQWVFVCGDYY
jgi:hypothetical protein